MELSVFFTKPTICSIKYHLDNISQSRNGFMATTIFVDLPKDISLKEQYSHNTKTRLEKYCHILYPYWYWLNKKNNRI